MTRTRALPRLKLVAAALLVSTGGAAIKATTLTGWQVACFRSGVAALAVFLLAREARRGWSWRAALVGVAYAATLILFVTANKLTTSANTIFLQATAPLYMVVLSPWLLGERLRREDLIVMAAVAVGLALVLAGHDAPVATAPDPARGNVLAALSGLTWALTVCGLRWVGDEARGGSAVPSVVLGNAIAFLAALPVALPLGASRAGAWAVSAAASSLSVVALFESETANSTMISRTTRPPKTPYVSPRRREVALAARTKRITRSNVAGSSMSPETRA